MVRATAATIVLASLLMAACTTPPRVGPAETRGGNTSLAGTRWALQALGTDVVPHTPTVTLSFGLDGQITGNDGCNQYQGAYSADGSSIEIARSLAGTLMACSDPVDAQARTYLEALQRAARFAVDDIRLSLHDGTGRLLATFVPAISSPVNTNWEVIAYNNGKQGVVSLLPGTRVSASFGNDGRVTGNAGCNQYFATYKLDGQAMSIGMAAATRKFCAEPEGLMQQEALYLEALKSTSTFRLNGDRLELRAEDGALAATLNRSAGE
jgi:heat shock protein HslJ